MSNSKSLLVYLYPKCGTCRSAVKWLEAKGHSLTQINLFEHPPEADKLKTLIHQSGKDIKAFFNVSGEVYKAMNLKDKLPELTETEKINLLASNGRLIKRPIVTDGTSVTVGYKETEYEAVWS